MVTVKECKSKERQDILQELQWMEDGKEEDTVKDGETKLSTI
jgi:hypothetical protein